MLKLPGLLIVFDRVDGIWGLRIGRSYTTLCAPWRRPLYSERIRSGMKVLPIGFGWRLRFRRDSV